MPNLRLLPQVKGLLTASLRVLDFIRIDHSYQFSRTVKDEGLIDFELMDLVRQKLEAQPGTGELSLGMPEWQLIYLAIDLHCKAYFSDLAPHLERQFVADTRSDTEAFIQRRSLQLTLAERLLPGLAAQLEGSEAFARVRQRLDDLHRELLDD